MEGSGSPAKEEKLPPGFRFHPTDEELITYYLLNKISDATFTGRAIGDVDLNKCEPWDLPGKAKMGEKEWYFFSLRDRKYPTGVRTNRATNSGYWKTTGKDREIYNSETAELVGMKKTLVFYRGRAPRGEKTNWVMHEYRIHSKSSYKTNKQDEWVVCRVIQKSAGGRKFPSTHSRAVNPFPYNLDVPQNHPMHAHIIQPDNFQFPGRNYITSPDIQEYNKVLISGGGGGGAINFPIPPQVNNYGASDGCFTISGLNLSRNGSGQPLMRAAAPPGMNQHDVASTSLNGDPSGGYGGEMSSSRFMPKDQCGGNLDNYWPY